MLQSFISSVLALKIRRLIQNRLPFYFNNNQEDVAVEFMTAV